MRNFRLVLALLFASSVSLAQDFSNKGKEFWVGYGNHQVMYTNNGQGFDLYFTSDVNTTATVEIPGTGYTAIVPVTANQISSLNIPQSATLSEEGKFNKGIHVVAERPIVVYAHLYFQAVSGATLVLPVATLGREYYSINYTQYAQANISDAYSFFFVVATEDNTTVEITPAAGTIGGRAANVPFTETLNRGEVYQVLSNTDLTGSFIRSVNTGAGCKKIAVYSGSGRIGIGCGPSVTSSDNLFQQVYPNSTWGKKYITVPSMTRPRNYFRVIRPDISANIRLNGTVVPAASFVNNFYYEFESSVPNVIESDKPIQVAQYFTTQACGENTLNGDPEMIFLNPVEQTINDVTLTSMRLINPQANAHFINIVLQNNTAAMSSLKLDGIPVGGFTPVPADPGYVYVQLQTQLGTHRITSDSGFNAIAYGFGNAESYGYSAGTNLKDLYQFVQIRNQYATVNAPSGCKNTPFNFAMVFPYQPLSFEWKFNGLFPDETVTSPVYDSTWVVNGRQLYRYTLNKNYDVPAVGTYPINIIAQSSTSDGCSGTQEIDYDLQIFDTPKADFNFTTSGCSSDSVSFNDISGTLNTRLVNQWKWDLGDNSLSDKKSFRYKYAEGRKYNVTLQAITELGCISDPVIKEVVLENIPLPSFDNSVACKDATVTFTDLSDPNGSTIQKWRWDYGDGAFDSSIASTPVNHVYIKTGTYSAKLTLVNSKGCISNTFSKDIKVNTLPVSGFVLPEVCLNDAFAEFIDTSKVQDGSTLSYAWDFGDGSTGTDRSPRHKYTSARTYNVKQIITTSLGCKDTSISAFTVNGALPKATVQIKSSGPLCSNRVVELTNNSGVDFGKVTKLEIIWDLDNTPSAKVVDEEPTVGKTYQHVYPPFGSPALKKLKIKVLAYSGTVCFGETIQEVELLASPQMVFNEVPSICENVAAFQITQASETSGLTGTARYTGRGVDDKGMFTPAAAGRGSHNIDYIFTTSAGCVDTASRVIVVKEVPKADAGPDRAVLSGGYVVLNATASGTGIRINWTPPSYLDDPTKINPKVSPPDDITYTLTVSTADGCTVSDEVFVKFLDEIKIPNTFTPNGDGYNDRWEILSLDSYPGSVLEVYNTAGQLMYRTVGYAKPWDGTNNGRQVPAGTYYYVIDPKNGRKKMAGYVTIIR
jgi:gliding motility-associated-like protein